MDEQQEKIDDILDLGRQCGLWHKYRNDYNMLYLGSFLEVLGSILNNSFPRADAI